MNQHPDSDELTAIDNALDRFDAAWHRGETPVIDDFLLPAEHAQSAQLLVELIKIDLEYRWQLPTHARREDCEPGLPWFALLRDYQRQFPQLGTIEALPLDLIVEEYRVRCRWGDRPRHAAYVAQYGRESELTTALTRIDEELGRRQPSEQGLDATPSLILDSHPSMSTPASPTDLSVGDEIDDFRLLNRLGSGAFAEVFLAQQISMQRLVALKVSADRNYEPQLLSSLDHPNIVRVFDERVLGPLSLLYMQYVSGGSLKEIVDRMRADWPEPTGVALVDTIAVTLEEKGQLPTHGHHNPPVRRLSWSQTVCWIGARIADALAHAHEKGVLHRDIKPENILLTTDAMPMLVDFNLSFGESIEGMSAHDRFGGSLAYMSPQQLRVFTGEAKPIQVDYSSDLFSLSVVLWELLTGSRPYPDQTAEQPGNERYTAMLRERHVGPDFAELPADCPGGLRRTLQECLTTNTSAELSPIDSIVRRLHLALLRPVDRLLNPEPNSWAARWAKFPTTWLLIVGLLPNIVLSLVNIWANGRLTVDRFDLELFKQTQQPVINAVNFSIGITCGLWILVPVIKATWAQQSGLFERLPEWERIGHRCLRAPGWMSVLIFALWTGSGIAFPLWNQTSPHSDVGTLDFFAFFSSQILHGLIAAATTYVLISLVSVHALFPRFLHEHEDPTGAEQLDAIERQLEWANICLGLTPLLAVLVLGLSVSAEVDNRVFVVLAIVGAISFFMTWKLTPPLVQAIRTLRLALAPTEQITRMEPTADAH